ncbi:MAG TPA: MXAN_5187 C-terminal domain-containing protein [Polyangiaceae bacterium]|nr:MXAN_5187 C-terminal domain-containing protein [Polyangiaceae bacterium]
MRWKIIVVNAGILIVVGLLSFVLLATSLRELFANPAERKREVEQALRAASAQLSLDGLRMERWLEQQSDNESARAVFSIGVPEARNQAATVDANRLRDAAVSEPTFAKMAPTLVLYVDDQGIAIGRNGSALMRGDNIAAVYPDIRKSLKAGSTGSAVWLNRQRQEQLLVSYAPLRSETGKILGALVVGTPLNDERMTRTSELTSGHTLVFQVVNDKSTELLADSNDASSEVVNATSSSAVVSAARAAQTSGTVVHAEAEISDHVFGAIPLFGYAEQKGVLVAAVPSSIVGSVYAVLWPLVAVAALGLVLVVIGGTLLGNYISGPVSELEDGLLAIINGSSDLRFQIEHDELGGLVFRINSLLNALMGVPEDTTDEQGRPSHAPRAQDFQEALAVDESAVSEQGDPDVAEALAKEPADKYYRRLFEEYIAAKRKLGDPVDHITFEAFRVKIQASEQEMSQKHGRPVRYQVQLRGNSVVLTAISVS